MGSNLDEEPDWTLEDHLREGRLALAKISSEGASAEPQPVCHHFSEVIPTDLVKQTREEVYPHLERTFASEFITFATDRLEGWEKTQPDTGWLEARIPALVRISVENDLIYLGWTWEPRGMQPIGACTLTVINNRSN